MTKARLIKSNKAQAMTEYVLVVACVSLVFLVYSKFMAKAITLLYGQVVTVFHWPIP